MAKKVLLLFYFDSFYDRKGALRLKAGMEWSRKYLFGTDTAQQQHKYIKKLNFDKHSS